MEKEYIVALHKDVDYDTFWRQMETVTGGLQYIPDRIVRVIDNRDGSLRCCHYSLTDYEADILRNDPRIFCIEIPPSQRTDIQLNKFTSVQTGDFTKPTGATGSEINWGLVRCSNQTNVYGANIYPAANAYYYDWDGTGVDVVISDSGIEVGHPEFQNAQGKNRVQLINWFTVANVAGTQNANFYRDYDGHGTHCASISAGKNFGWAKNANIYALKINGLAGAGDAGTGINEVTSFDLIAKWHLSKPIEPATGYKRPTVVSASWGYTSNIWNTDISSITYRGNSYTGASISGPYNKWYKGMAAVGVLNANATDLVNWVTSARVGSVDVGVQECLDAGVLFIHAAGNNYAKSDLPNGPDFNNFYTQTSTGTIPHYHNRGVSPTANGAVNVGAIDTVVNGLLDRKVNFSNTAEIYAPGTNIKGACSNTNIRGGVTYMLGNSLYKQVSISGTSQACPQVAGIAALYLQSNPGATPAQFKQWLSNIGSATNVIYDTGNDANYTNYNALMGSPNKFAYSNIAVIVRQLITFGISGNFNLNNLSLTYT